MLLTQNAMIGKLGIDQTPDRQLGLLVGLGHGIETSRLLVVDGSLSAEPGQRLGRGNSGDAPKKIG
jgi:hypothetical protein